MENLPNYRVKVDLSEFYKDVRKLSYVYVNEKSTSHILHLHERIKKIFGITRPFYLTCEGVYLPLNEDVRIIQGEETITVSPGSVNPNCLTLWKEIGVKSNGKPLSTIQVPKSLENENSRTPIEKTNGSITESERQSLMSLPEDSDTDATQDPQRTVENPETSGMYSIPQNKRRRVRKRRSKPDPEPQQPPPIVTPTPRSNPVFNSPFSPKIKPKHFKFNWEDNEEVNNTTERNGETGVPELNTLLSLKNCQFPVTFVGQKTKCEGPVQQGHEGSHQSPARTGNEILDSNSSKKMDFSNVNPLDYPIHNQDLMEGDVVAFRVLKIGSDYSPTISGYIVAENVSRNSELGTYSLKIISGEDQLKDPEGKFSLLTEEELENSESTPNKNEIHTTTKEELLELRLIHRQNTQ
uniref:COIL protein n=1 Tax=Fopius arisanus TaxID=64838 RepID=A0A0C9RLV1_9HYME